jgi:hypothetical protein
VSRQPDRDCLFLEQLAGWFLDKSAAAGRDHAGALIEQPGDDSPFAVAELGFPELCEHLAGGQPARIADRIVAVDEVQFQPFGEPPPDCGLASTHHSDKRDRTVETRNEVGHRSGYTAAVKVGQKPGETHVSGPLCQDRPS